MHVEKRAVEPYVVALDGDERRGYHGLRVQPGTEVHP
jgi:hypothetical protein